MKRLLDRAISEGVMQNFLRGWPTCAGTADVAAGAW